MGTMNLLNAALEIWKEDFSYKIFYHISKDKVYAILLIENLTSLSKASKSLSSATM
jgi:dTDP-glucose 4,6-dehydratase